jgi:hypothetical protein
MQEDEANRMTLTTDELERLQYHLEGTCQTLGQALDQLELNGHDHSVIEDQLLDQPHPVEECKGCAWWFEVGDLVRENEADCGYCDQCKPDQE